MSKIEYNNILFQISRRLEELNVRRQLLAMCRGKIASRSEDSIQDVFSLFEELEEKGFLGPDNLEMVKELLEGVEEWYLFGKVENFESRRREYMDFLEPIIRALDEINDLERLLSMCRSGKIPEESQGNIHDARSLFEVLEDNNWLGINRLGILKEILTELEKEDLVKELKEFEKRRLEDKKSKSRKGKICVDLKTKLVKV